MNKKILVVDDEPDIRFLLKDILEDEGFDVSVAENADQASQLKNSFPPSLILLDIWMPDMDGVSLLKQWHEQKALACPVVMMSGHGTVETAVEATRFGAFDFVEKPLSTARLLRTVNAALSQSDSQAEGLPHSTEMPVGNSQQVQLLRKTLQTQAADGAPVFFIGEPGSGRSIWANYLFSRQQPVLKTGNFVEGLQHARSGLEENIYIAEVSDLNLQKQKALLSLIHHLKSVKSIGRLVVASQFGYELLAHKSEILPELAEYFRNAIQIPSLNEHIEDIPELVEYYVSRCSELEGLPYRHFGVAGQNTIRNHNWQGGLSELKAVIRKILQSSSAQEVELEEIQQVLQQSQQVVPANAANTLQLSIDLDLDMRQARKYFEKEYLARQLELCSYNVSELARKTGQERTNLYRKLKALGLQTRK